MLDSLVRAVFVCDVVMIITCITLIGECWLEHWVENDMHDYVRRRIEAELRNSEENLTKRKD